MSHQPSPAPSGSSLAAPTAPSGRIKASAKQPMPAGVAANVEEIKYKAKYKELRKKVKEIEHENDQLYYKVLVARRNVQRMRLERAVLYERLTQLPPSPRHDNPPLPPPVAVLAQPYAPNHATPVTREPSERLSARDLEFQELLRANPNGTISVVPGPDGRPIPVMDAGPTRTPLLLHQTGRRTSGEDRHLPPLPNMPSAHMESRHSQHGHNAAPYLHANNLNHPAAPTASRVRPSSSHSQTSRLPSPPYVPPPPALAQPAYSPHIGSPSTRSGSPGTVASGGYTNSHRVHNHQRMGPGTNMNMEEWERQREERIRERDIERDRRQQYDSQHAVASRDSHARLSAEDDTRPAQSPNGSADDGSTSRGDGDEPLNRTSPSRAIHAGPADDEPIGRSPPPESSSAAAAPDMARKRTAEMDVDGADSQPQRHTPVGGQTADNRERETTHSQASDEDEASKSRTGGEQDDAMDAD